MRTFTILAVSAVLLSAGCGTETPTTAVVDNEFPASSDVRKESTVYDVWYVTTLFRDPVAPGASSDAQRTIPADDYAYAVLAVGWDPSSSTLPGTVMALRSDDKLSVSRGDTLQIDVSDATFRGDCRAGKPLSQSDADFITERIFPGPFAGIHYDAATCAATPLPSSDAGLESGAPSDSGTILDAADIDAKREP